MKIVHVYRSEPNDTTKKLVAMVSEGRETESMNLYGGTPDYSKLVDLIMAADQTSHRCARLLNSHLRPTADLMDA